MVSRSRRARRTNPRAPAVACGLIAIALSLFASPLAAEVDIVGLPQRLQQAVRDGDAELLEREFGPGASPQQLEILAAAWVNHCRKADPGDALDLALRRAEEAFARWVASAARVNTGRNRADQLLVARAHLESGNFLLSHRVAPILDELEITNFARGDRARALQALDTAADEYRRAQQATAPLADTLAKNSESLQAEGLYESIQQIATDTQYNAAWTAYHRGMLQDRSARELADVYLQAALRDFSSLLTSIPEGQSHLQCRLGLALCLRELRRYDDAQREFQRILGESLPPALAGQARYEFARSQMAAGEFEPARQTLSPLAATDLSRLPPEAGGIRFYVNLARLWQANSYLFEAEKLREAARTGGSPDAISRANTLRDQGLAAFRKLREAGGNMAELVPIYLSATLDPTTDPKQLGPAELLAVGETLLARNEFAPARERITLALGKSTLPAALRADLLFALGRCDYALNDPAAAAAAFLKVATEHKNQPQAAKAASNAAALLAAVAEQSATPAAFDQTATALKSIIDAQPTHPEAVELRWTHAVVLQRARRFADAARAYAAVPPEHPRAEEARFRQAYCARLVAEHASTRDEREQRESLLSAASILSTYAKDARRRADAGPRAADAAKWAAEAAIAAAEVYLTPAAGSPAEALTVLLEFERTFPNDQNLGRALALQVKAYQALNQLDQAAGKLRQLTHATSPDRAQPVLIEIAQALRAEVMKRAESDDEKGARALAATAIEVLRLLQDALAATASAPASNETTRRAEVVALYLAEMHFFAGALDAADSQLQTLSPTVRDSLDAARLTALLALARADAGAPVGPARDAWGVLLRSPDLKSRAPARYWEARYYYLSLTLRMNAAEDVEKAIRNERAFDPQLGGERWKKRFDDLYDRAKSAAAGG